MSGRARVRPVFLTVCLGRVRALLNPALCFYALAEGTIVKPGYRPLHLGETLRVGDWVYYIGFERCASEVGRFIGDNEFTYLQESIQEDPDDWYPYALRRKEEA